MAAKKKPATKAAAAAPSASNIALSRRVAKVMTRIPVAQQRSVADAVSGAASFAALPANVKAAITAAEKA